MLVLSAVPVAQAEECIPGDASDVTIKAPGVGTWYIVLSGGTPVLYYEENGIPGLQRGGIGLTGDCFPGHGTIPPDPNGDLIPCLIIDEDPVTDENCGTSPDHLVF